MGDPKKVRKKYSPPRHPWERARIDEEKELSKEYGFKSKKEIWKVKSKLKTFKDRAKKLSAGSGKQVEKETKQLLQKLKNLSLIKQDQDINEILGSTASSLSDRRLQTIVYKKNLARSMKQARQMIVHRHITVNNVKITAPSHIVSSSEEPTITYAEDSPFFSVDHPERINAEDSIAKTPEEAEELALKKERDKKREKKKAIPIEAKENKKASEDKKENSKEHAKPEQKEKVKGKEEKKSEKQAEAEQKEDK